ncbi:MAG TPA: DUF2277 domain-containing protein [Bryobacteraceae bacterium]|nr:DUF2277 domain-containing protein [Bryobacteraceae bacterium]
MCRSIKVLRKPGEPATPDELHAAALQFVRKISGFQKPSKVNQEAFERAVREVAEASGRLLETVGPARVRVRETDPALDPQIEVNPSRSA